MIIKDRGGRREKMSPRIKRRRERVEHWGKKRLYMKLDRGNLWKRKRISGRVARFTTRLRASAFFINWETRYPCKSRKESFFSSSSVLVFRKKKIFSALVAVRIMLAEQR